MNLLITISGVIRQAVNKVQLYADSIVFLKSILSPAQTLNDRFVLEADKIAERAKYSSQKKSLETRLNNIYDESHRRIYIQTIPPLFVEFFYSKFNTNRTYVYAKSNNKNTYRSYYKSTYKALAALGINFVVYVPPDVLMAQRDSISAEVTFYALAGKNWVLRATNEIILIPTTLTSI